MWRLEIPEGATPIGYKYLVEQFQLQVTPHYCVSYVCPNFEKRRIAFESQHIELCLHPKSVKVGDCPLEHLVFSLKNEGVNLLIIKQLFEQIPAEEVTRFIQNAPVSKYRRKIWFFYEWLSKRELPIADIGKGTYVELLDSKLYYTAVAEKSARHRILNNLLGEDSFSPLVRRSNRLQKLDKLHLKEEISQLTSSFNSNVLARAMRYLYTKETIASWEIEREKPNKERLVRFVNLLEKGENIGEFSKNILLEIQEEIVDPRFSLDDYRDFQNYIGEEPGVGKMIVHYIAPKPEDIATLMEGFIQCFQYLDKSEIHPIVIAAVISFGFVFLHPFWDGNGRLHRFLIHYILSKKGFAPKGVVFPISAVILRNVEAYDKVLESFSKPLLKLILDYSIDVKGEMKVTQDTFDFYRFIDFTPMVEFLFQCVQETIHVDFERELIFLNQYDEIKQSLKSIVDMPDQKIDLFIRCVRQNDGQLSQKKRLAYFEMLTDREIEQMVETIRRQ